MFNLFGCPPRFCNFNRIDAKLKNWQLLIKQEWCHKLAFFFVATWLRSCVLMLLPCWHHYASWIQTVKALSYYSFYTCWTRCSLLCFKCSFQARYLRVQVAVLLKESDHTSPWTLWIIEANSHSYKNPIYINEQPPTIGSQHEGCGSSIILEASPKLPSVPVSASVNKREIQGEPALLLKSHSHRHTFAFN